MNLILGAGLTGLGAARASGFTVLERASGPGGICRSYYVAPGTDEHLDTAPPDGEAYRFEIGGGHWLFGGDAEAIGLIDRLTPLRRYRRRAAVWLRHPDRAVPYPLQAHLDELGPARAAQIAAERAGPGDPMPAGATMREWLLAQFGPTLFELFFDPFHERYTAGLHHRIAPQDPYKTPTGSQVGYNDEFAYPVAGLDELTRRLAPADVRYDREVVAIEPDHRRVRLADGDALSFETLLSTLPLDVTLRLAGIELAVEPDPHTSVLVLNIGAERGPACPEVHWLYEPAADAHFHRIGFYSNVDDHFVPRSRADTAVALYVERAYVGGDRPDAAAVATHQRQVIEELQARRFIGAVDVVDPSWVEVAYTWSGIGSTWPTEAIAALDDRGITVVGRYARWHFQGMAESLADGLAAGRQARVDAGR